jgi:hypothetical protein
MAPLHIDGVILVGQPVAEGMAELVLGDEGAAGRASNDQNVEPGDVIADEEAMGSKRLADLPDSRAADPGRRSEEPARPARPAEKGLCRDVDRRARGEQQEKRGDARRRDKLPSLRFTGCG